MSVLLVALLLVAPALLAPAAALAQGLATTIDRTAIPAAGRVVVELRTNRDVRRVLPPQSEDFVLVAAPMYTSMQVINGQVSRELTQQFVLAPTRVGVLDTGALEVILADGRTERLPGHRVTVTGDPAGLAGGGSPSRRMVPGDPVPGAAGTGAAGAGAVGTGSVGGGGDPAPDDPNAVDPDDEDAGPGPMAMMPPLPDPTAQAMARPPSRPIAHDDDGSLPPLPGPGERGMIAAMPESRRADVPFVVAWLSSDELVTGQPVVVDYLYYVPVAGLGFDAQDLTEPAFTNAWFREISDLRVSGSRRLGSRTIDGRIHDVQVVRSYVVVPLRDGTLTVPPLELTLMPRSFSRRDGLFTVRSEPLEVEVSPPPEPPAALTPGHGVGRYTWRWEVSPRSARVGDTVNVRLVAEGVGAPARLTMPTIEVTGEARTYEPVDQSRAETVRPGWIRTTYVRTISVQPLQTGELAISIPPLVWYDPWRRAWDHASGERFTILVAGVNPDVDLGAAEGEWGRSAWRDGLPDARPLSRRPGWLASLRMRGEPWAGSPLYFSLLAAPVVLLMLWMAVVATRTRRQELVTEHRTSTAEKRAIRELERLAWTGDEVFGQLARIASVYLDERAGLNVRGMTVAELALALRSRWPVAVADLLHDAITEAQSLRYGGGDERAFVRLRANLVSWLSERRQEAP